MRRLVSKFPRVLAVFLVSLVGLELAYVGAGTWFLASRLDALGIRATRPFTAYPGDVRARALELSSAGGVVLRATDVHGRVRLRSLLDGSLELTSVDAGRLDVNLPTFTAIARAWDTARAQDARPRTKKLALIASGWSTRRLKIDRFQGRLGELRVSGVTWRGPGDVSLSSVVFAPRLASAVAIAHLGRGALRRSEGGPDLGTLEGEFELGVEPTARSTSGAQRVRVAASLRGEVDDTRALLRAGPKLSIKQGVLELEARAVRTGPGHFEPRSESLTATASGNGEDAGALLDLLEVAPAVRWMFEELSGETYAFQARGALVEGAASVERLHVETARTAADAKLTFRGGQPSGLVLMTRGDFRLGLALEPGSSRIVTAPPPDWLERESAGPSP